MRKKTKQAGAKPAKPAPEAQSQKPSRARAGAGGVTVQVKTREETGETTLLEALCEEFDNLLEAARALVAKAVRSRGDAREDSRPTAGGREGEGRESDAIVITNFADWNDEAALTPDEYQALKAFAAARKLSMAESVKLDALRSAAASGLQFPGAKELPQAAAEPGSLHVDLQDPEGPFCHVAFPPDLSARLKRVAAELGVELSTVIKTAVLWRLDREEAGAESGATAREDARLEKADFRAQAFAFVAIGEAISHPEVRKIVAATLAKEAPGTDEASGKEPAAAKDPAPAPAGAGALPLMLSITDEHGGVQCRMPIGRSEFDQLIAFMTSGGKK